MRFELHRPFKLLPIIASLTLVLSGCGEENAETQTKIAAGKVLVENGRDAIPACVSCHGANGEGMATFPRLAGLDEKYIAKQLYDYARDPLQVGANIPPVARDYSKTPRIYSDLTVFSPGIRHDAIMSGIAKELTTEEVESVAAYYSRLPFVAEPKPINFQVLERGQDLAERGKPEYGMPSCNSCHGPEGDGFGEHFPPLAGQPPEYIIEQINRWQNGSRDNDHIGLMRAVSEYLTDGDKYNIAAYYSNKSYSVNVE